MGAVAIYFAEGVLAGGGDQLAVFYQLASIGAVNVAAVAGHVAHGIPGVTHFGVQMFGGGDDAASCHQFVAIGAVNIAGVTFFGTGSILPTVVGCVAFGSITLGTSFRCSTGGGDDLPQGR